MDLLDLFDRGSAWTQEKIAGAVGKLDAQTPCDEWDVRTLLNHLMQGQKLFQGGARGEPAAPPAAMPPDVLGDDPVAQYEEARQATMAAYREPGALENHAFLLGIGFVDQLVHGWDLAKATGQDTAMPSDLAETAFGLVNGQLPTDGSSPFFKAAVQVPDDAPAQDKLLGLGGRDPN
jgi:uncharacterized protein (TIGR03086 family)